MVSPLNKPLGHAICREPLSTVYSRVQARRDSGFCDVLGRKSVQEKMQMVIDITGADDNNEGDRNIPSFLDAQPSKPVLIGLIPSEPSWIMQADTIQVSRLQRILLPPNQESLSPTSAKDSTSTTLRLSYRECRSYTASAATAASYKKSEAILKALDKAQTALLKFEVDAVSLTEKDWGDVIRWVIPEAKVEFLLKDLKKCKQILASSRPCLASG
jgi:hypothetical protein